jgi:phosphate-selective porin OprO/OprP
VKRHSVRLELFLSWVCLVTAGATSAESQESTFNNIWRFATWYDNDTAPVVQTVLFSGRFQYEYASVDDGKASHDEWNVRRMRLGIRTGLLQRLTLHVEADFNPQERDPLYKRLTDTYLQWSFGPRLATTLGKQSVPFTVDGSTSSKELLTVARSNLANNIWFPQEYVPGVSFSGSGSGWSYRVGAYSAGGRNGEFGEFDGSFFTLASLGYDFGGQLEADQVLVRGSYVYQSPDVNNTFTGQLQHVASLNFLLAYNRWGIRSDASTAAGYMAQSNLWGTMLMPYLNVTSALQLVSRFTYLDSDGPNGVRLARYENQLVDGRGDQYSELYLGANYFFYGHKLKFQGGLQIAEMKDSMDDGGSYSGVALTSGLRMSW